MSSNIKTSKFSVLSSKLINLLKQNKNGIADNRLKNELGLEYEELCPVINDLLVSMKIERISKPGIYIND